MVANGNAGIYSVPHFDYHFYFVGEESVRNITHGPCSMVGLLSEESWYRALKPMPLQCYPTGAYVNSGLAVAGVWAPWMSS